MHTLPMQFYMIRINKSESNRNFKFRYEARLSFQSQEVTIFRVSTDR